MSFTVGRASLPVDPSSATWNGDTLTIEGWISPTVANDTNQAYAIRQQLLGLVDNDDESVFPCTFSVDPDWDGFYTAESVRVEGRPGLMETQGRMPYTLVLRRVGGFTAPQFECIATTVVATNSHGLPTATPRGILALPYTDLQEASIPRAFSTGATYDSFGNGTTRTTDDGLIRHCRQGSDSPFRFVWATPPAYYYEGSARFEQSYGGTYYPLHGQQARPAASAWRVSNGLVRVTINSSTISVSHYDGSAWDAAKLWTVGSGGSPLLQGQPLVRVVRNTPEEVVVRCLVEMDTTVSTTTIDISLRRGCRWAAFSLTSSYTTDWYINASPNEAGTALTGGFRATATDASGNRYVVGGLAAQTNTLASGRLKLTTTAQTFNFVIGSEVGADGSGQDLLNEYAQTVIENHRVVVR